jgi:PEP-CTERM motif
LANHVKICSKGEEEMMRRTILLAVGLILLVVPGAFADIILNITPSDVFQQTINNPCVIGDSSCKQPTTATDVMDYTQVSGTPDQSWNRSTTSPSFSATNGAYDLMSPVPLPDLTLPQNVSFDFHAHAYTVNNSGLLANNFIPSTFQIGIDTNFASEQEQLVGFVTWVSTDDGSTWNPDPNNSWGMGFGSGAGNVAPTLLAQHNGNGYSDALLSGFSLTPGNQVFFEAIYGLEYARGPQPLGADADGMEEFFLIPSGSPPVVPEPATLLLLGSGLVGLWGARRKLKK